MTGCQTCGGYGMRHDPIAHGTEPYGDDDIGGLGSGSRYPITFYRDANRPVEVGTPVYDSDGQVVAHVVNVANDGTLTIRAPKPEEAS